MSKLKVEYIKKEKLKPYVNNAKLHTGEQVEQIKKSIEEFGFNDPIAVWHDNEIIEGHGRLLAVMEMEDITEVPIIRLDDLTEDQRKAYVLVHNKLTMNTGFDDVLLNLELDDIEIDMEQFGFNFSDEEIEEIAKEEEGEEEFTEVLGEEHNYIVLYFDNEVDWLQLQSLIDIEEKLNLSTRKDGVINEKMKRKSIGRVFNGKEVLERLREHYENIN